jgi:hypothetical protein
LKLERLQFLEDVGFPNIKKKGAAYEEVSTERKKSQRVEKLKYVMKRFDMGIVHPVASLAFGCLRFAIHLHLFLKTAPATD